MILSFKTHWTKTMPEHMSGKPTCFPEKIWQSIPDEYTVEHFQQYLDGLIKINYDFDVDAVSMYPKLHTIRADQKYRWHAGRDIHFVINNRSKNQFQFAPVVKCVSVQTIEIKYIPLTKPLGEKRPYVKVDGKLIYGIDKHNYSNMETPRN